MPVPAMNEPVINHQRRFQAAVDVIQNLPKNGSYSPSYEVMLRFYSLYKQAICGPCTAARPGFWDPVGRYKWDAWSRLGEMSCESAMAAYVDEMKKVAQEVIDTTPINEKTASLFHHFEPLYLVIDDMPRPPEFLLTVREGVKVSTEGDKPAEMKTEDEAQETPKEDVLPENLEIKAAEILTTYVQNDSGVSECLALTSDSESEIFCDSVDSVEQLSSIKVPVLKTNGFHNGHVSSESSQRLEPRRVGAGQGGEGGSDGKDQGPASRRRDGGREDAHHSRRERGVPQGGPRWGGPGGGGAGRGGADGSEGGAERLHDTQLQQQIIVALRRLREDMRSVMERLEVVERLAATHVQGPPWGTCLQCSASHQQEDEDAWWPFDVSAHTLLLFLVWPFVAQGVVHLLRKAHKRSRLSS